MNVAVSPKANIAEILKLPPDKIADMARKLRQDGYVEEAFQLLEPALAQYPENPTVQFQMGKFYDTKVDKIMRTLGQNGDPRDEKDEAHIWRQKAIVHFKAASDLKPDHYMFAFRAGDYARRAWDKINAAFYLRRAHLIEPDNAFPWARMGEVHKRARNYEKANICFQNALCLHAQDKRIIYKNLEEIGSKPEQNWTLNKDIELFSLSGQRNLRRDALGKLMDEAAQYKSAGEWVKALGILEDGLAQYPDSSGLHFRIARIYDDTLTLVLSGNPKLNVIHAPVLGVNILRQRTVMHFQRASDMEPRKFISALFAGRAMRHARDAKAGPYICRALAIEPGNYEAWDELGEVYWLKSDRQNAGTCFQNALILKPDDHKAREGLQKLGLRLPHNATVNYKPAGLVHG